MDGVGKTTVGMNIAKELNFEFIEKPLHYLLYEDGDLTNHMKISSNINEQDNI